MKDTLVIGGHEFQSRFILGSGKYSLDLINAAVQNAGAQIITLALRRANEGGTANILDYIPEGVTLLPNTSGARNADEAVRIARLSRACGCGDFVKIEIMRDSKYLLPDNQETIRATEILAKEGFADCGLAAVENEQWQTAVIDRTGKIVIAYTDSPVSVDFSDTMVAYRYTDHSVYYATDGKHIGSYPLL